MTAIKKVPELSSDSSTDSRTPGQSMEFDTTVEALTKLKFHTDATEKSEVAQPAGANLLFSTQANLDTSPLSQNQEPIPLSGSPLFQGQEYGQSNSDPCPQSQKAPQIGTPLFTSCDAPTNGSPCFKTQGPAPPSHSALFQTKENGQHNNAPWPQSQGPRSGDSSSLFRSQEHAHGKTSTWPQRQGPPSSSGSPLFQSQHPPADGSPWSRSQNHVYQNRHMPVNGSPWPQSQGPPPSGSRLLQSQHFPVDGSLCSQSQGSPTPNSSLLFQNHQHLSANVSPWLQTQKASPPVSAPVFQNQGCDQPSNSFSKDSLVFQSQEECALAENSESLSSPGFCSTPQAQLSTFPAVDDDGAPLQHVDRYGYRYVEHKKLLFAPRSQLASTIFDCDPVGFVNDADTMATSFNDSGYNPEPINHLDSNSCTVSHPKIQSMQPENSENHNPAKTNCPKPFNQPHNNRSQPPYYQPWQLHNAFDQTKSEQPRCHKYLQFHDAFGDRTISLKQPDFPPRPHWHNFSWQQIREPSPTFPCPPHPTQNVHNTVSGPSYFTNVPPESSTTFASQFVQPEEYLYQDWMSAYGPEQNMGAWQKQKSNHLRFPDGGGNDDHIGNRPSDETLSASPTHPAFLDHLGQERKNSPNHNAPPIEANMGSDALKPAPACVASSSKNAQVPIFHLGWHNNHVPPTAHRVANTDPPDAGWGQRQTREEGDSVPKHGAREKPRNCLHSHHPEEGYLSLSPHVPPGPLPAQGMAPQNSSRFEALSKIRPGDLAINASNSGSQPMSLSNTPTKKQSQGFVPKNSSSDASDDGQDTQSQRASDKCLATAPPRRTPAVVTRSSSSRSLDPCSSVVRVLLVFSNPKNTDALRLQAEERAVRQALVAGPHGAAVELHVLPAATAHDLARALLSDEYQVVQFSGHSDPTVCLMRQLLLSVQQSHGKETMARIKKDAGAMKRLKSAAEDVVNKLMKLFTADGKSKRDSIESEKQQEKAEDSFEVNLPALASSSLAALGPAKGVDGKDTHRINRTNHGHHGGGAKKTPVSVNLHLKFTAEELLCLGVGALAFEHDTGDGKMSLVHPRKLANILGACSPPLECIVLNACGSQIQGALLSKVIPYTVCAAGPISDRDSIQFSNGFYDALAAGKGYVRCFEEGERRMGLITSGHFTQKGSSQSENTSSGMVLLRGSRALQQEASAVSSDSPTMLKALIEENQFLKQSNVSLQKMISYGVKTLDAKDREIAKLRRQLAKKRDYVDHNNFRKKKGGSPGKNQSPKLLKKRAARLRRTRKLAGSYPFKSTTPRFPDPKVDPPGSHEDTNKAFFPLEESRRKTKHAEKSSVSVPFNSTTPRFTEAKYQDSCESAITKIKDSSRSPPKSPVKQPSRRSWERNQASLPFKSTTPRFIEPSVSAWESNRIPDKPGFRRHTSDSDPVPMKIKDSSRSPPVSPSKEPIRKERSSFPYKSTAPRPLEPTVWEDNRIPDRAMSKKMPADERGRPDAPPPEASGKKASPPKLKAGLPGDSNRHKRNLSSSFASSVPRFIGHIPP